MIATIGILLSGLLFLTACWDEKGLQSAALSYPITVVAVDPVNPNIVYAATRGNGIYRSVNSGASWSHVVGFLDPAVEALAVDLFDPDTLYAGTENGAYRSSDGGVSWQPPEPGSGTEIIAIVIDRNSCGPTKDLPCRIVYAASETGGVFKSADGGETWSSMNAGLTETAVKSLAIYPPLYFPGTFPDNCLDPPNPCNDIGDIPSLSTITTLYAGTEGGHVFRIQPSQPGLEWVEGNPGLSLKTTQEVLSLAVNPILYAGTRREEGPAGVYQSVDQGENWIKVTGLIPWDSVYVVDFAIAPGEGLTTYIGVSGLSKSVDGTNWEPINAGLDKSTLSLAIDPLDPTIMYLGSYNGRFFKTVDGGQTWDAIEIPL